MRMRKKKWAVPELDACPYYVPDADAHQGAWRALFPADQPLHVELGCGKGVSTAEMAWAEQDVNFVAIDLISDVLGVAKRNIERRYGDQAPDNIRLCNKEITRISECFGPDDRVQRLYISFPNPWSERRKHYKRRLTHPRQLLQYRDFLADGGEIWFKTDDEQLFDDTVGYLSACGFSIRYLTRDLHASGFEPNYQSEHELMFTARGVSTKFLIAKKVDLPSPPDLTRRKAAPELTTLCYIRDGQKTLMLHRVKKQDDLNAGKWIGIGGHFERGESPEDCLLREVKEETGLTLTRFTCRGVITFCYDQHPAEYMHLFTADAFEGELTACDEGVLKWVEPDEMKTLPMWAGDRIFLKLIEGPGPYFSLKLTYRGDALTSAVLDGRPLALDEGGLPS